MPLCKHILCGVCVCVHLSDLWPFTWICTYKLAMCIEMQIIKSVHADYHLVFLHFTEVVTVTLLHRNKMWLNVCCFLNKKFRNALCRINYENYIPIGGEFPSLPSPTSPVTPSLQSFHWKLYVCAWVLSLWEGHQGAESLFPIVLILRRFFQRQKDVPSWPWSWPRTFQWWLF